jgi:hypothetical protein
LVRIFDPDPFLPVRLLKIMLTKNAEKPFY